MEDKKKNKKLLILGIVTILLFVVGASYAYFTVGTTNSFGTHTISGTMEDVGSVALTSTGNNISLNLSAADMMQENSDKWYYGSEDGTPSTNFNVIKLADATVTGTGIYNCDYTMNITATGTNNMYTTFQGMSGKSTDQIMLNIFSGYNSIAHIDFNTPNLFPITYNGHINNVSNDMPGELYAVFGVVNSNSINQTALSGTDITMNITITGFTCSATTTYLREVATADQNISYWNSNYNSSRYDNNITLVNNNYNYYIKEAASQSRQIIANKHFYYYVQEIDQTYPSLSYCLNEIDEYYTCIKYNNVYIAVYDELENMILYDYFTDCNNVDIDGTGTCIEYNKGDIFSGTIGSTIYEVCGVFNGVEVCLNPNNYADASTYKSQMEAAGATCTMDDYSGISNDSNNYKLDNLMGDVNYSISKLGKRIGLNCSLNNLECHIDNGFAYCGEGFDSDYCGAYSYGNPYCENPQ